MTTRCNSQLDIAIPQLDEAGIQRHVLSRWRHHASRHAALAQVQRAGHELGNHSVFHPCPRSMLPDRPQYFTENYDVDRMLGEIAVMNNVLFGIDGREVAYLLRALQPDARGRSATTPSHCGDRAS